MILYQFNISWMREDWDHEIWDDFKAALPHVHRRAELSTGYVGRYSQDPYIMPYPNSPEILGNFSWWADVSSLRRFTFEDPVHAAIMKKRDKWFKFHGGINSVMYYGDEKYLNDIEEAIRRLNMIRRVGPTWNAFDWSTFYDVG